MSVSRIAGLTACIVCLWISPALSAVVTFTGLPGEDGFLLPWIEDGVTASSASGEVASFDIADAAHLDDSGSGYAADIDFVLGGLFNAISFDIIPTGNHYCSNPNAFNCADPYDNVLVEGFLGGSLISSDSFYMGDSPSTYLFGSGFTQIDLLTISALLPGGFCSDDPCAHFNIDNVALNSVPLPLSITLFFSGIGTLFFRQYFRIASALLPWRNRMGVA